MCRTHKELLRVSERAVLSIEVKWGETSSEDTYLKEGGLMSSEDGHSGEARRALHTEGALKSVNEARLGQLSP